MHHILDHQLHYLVTTEKNPKEIENAISLRSGNVLTKGPQAKNGVNAEKKPVESLKENKESIKKVETKPEVEIPRYGKYLKDA
ncbi:hypothetical protein HAX54_030196 [Datura stramonium]|uniref:Uncharacterized protein n=1 Tax=Datura stramonium TaxID=4076 RepID=A0ABS8VA50_DATST|nr:hypothetical protein [Datura stramonium]